MQHTDRQARFVRRAVEFNFEEESPAEVGSLLGSVAVADGGFERVADEDEAAEEKPKKKPAKSRSKKAAAEADAAPVEKKSRSKKKADDRAAEAKPKRSR
jgi:hypothetical protein